MKRLCSWILVLAVGGSGLGLASDEAKPISNPARLGTTDVQGRDLQQVIDQAPTNSLVRCDPHQPLTLTNSILITKPLTLWGLRARLPEGLDKTPLVIVASPGVTVRDFELVGNVDTVSQKQRAPLLEVRAGDFRIENGRFLNSSKDGVMISGNAGDIVGGVVRDIVGHRNARDTVSISGSDDGRHRVRNVLVDNVRCYDSALRGAVEVSDGVEHITIRKVYAEASVYAVDFQDHNKTNQVNRHVVIEDVYAARCKHAIRSANHPFGHAHLTVRDLTAQQCRAPVQISHVNHVVLANIRILDHDAKEAPISIKNCDNVSVRDVTVENTTTRGPAMLVEDGDGVLIDGFVLRGRADRLTSGICFRITTDERFSNLRISNTSALAAGETGILLETTGRGGTLSDYLISGNLARIADRIQGQRRLIANNVP